MVLQNFRNPEEDWAQYVPPRKVVVPVAVVEPKAAAKKAQLMAASDGALTMGGVKQQDSMVVLKPVRVALPYIPPPENLFSRTIIPLEIRAPTAKLVSDDFGSGYGMPWTTSPVSLPFAAPAVGALLVMIGRQVAAQMAIQGGELAIDELKKRYNRRDIQFRMMTGQSEGGKGNIVRPRGEDGSIPEGTDPYEDPDDFKWYKPWTWA